MTQVLPDLRVNAKPATSRFDRLPRVILSIRHFYPDGGGAEVLAYRLATQLVQKGLPIKILTGRYGGRPRAETIDGVVVHRHFIGLYIPVVHELCYLGSFAWELISRRHKYDIVHVFQTQLSAYVAAVVAKRLGKRLITTSHCAGKYGDMAVWSSLPGGRRLLQSIYANVDVATAVSNDVMAEMHEAGFDPERTCYLPNGVPIPPSIGSNRCALRVSLGLAREAFIAVFVGRLTAQKAPELLVDAWEALIQEYPSSQLVFIGDGKKKPMLEGRTRQAGLEDSIVFRGQVDNVEDYLRAADIFVLPSTTEGMSIALLEAMSFGLAVVATRVSGTADVIKNGQNGLLFGSGRVDELLECITSLIEFPKRRVELGVAARKTVEEHFNLDTVADGYMALYRSVLVSKCRSDQ